MFQAFLIIKPRSYRVIKLHRIIQQCKFEGTCKGYLIQSLWNDQGHLQLDQISLEPYPALNISGDGYSICSSVLPPSRSESLGIKIVYNGEQIEACRRLFRESLAVLLLQFNHYSLNDEQQQLWAQKGLHSWFDGSPTY